MAVLDVDLSSFTGPQRQPQWVTMVASNRHMIYRTHSPCVISGLQLHQSRNEHVEDSRTPHRLAVASTRFTPATPSGSGTLPEPCQLVANRFCTVTHSENIITAWIMFSLEILVGSDTVRPIMNVFLPETDPSICVDAFAWAKDCTKTSRLQSRFKRLPQCKVPSRGIIRAC